ncbi:MAG TPA: hypothetical protein VN969_29615 [Streptosporangiaceae bacterium]|nr:hypothetical protein [Streptosporangiaceae bacterium]
MLRVLGWLVLLPRSSPFSDAEDRGAAQGSRRRYWPPVVHRLETKTVTC